MITFEEYRDKRAQLWLSLFKGAQDNKIKEEDAVALQALDSEHPEYLQKIIDYPIEDTV